MKRQAICALATLALNGAAELAHSGTVGVWKFETTNAVLTLKADSGDLIGVAWKRPKLAIIGEARKNVENVFSKIVMRCGSAALVRSRARSGALRTIVSGLAQ